MLKKIPQPIIVGILTSIAMFVVVAFSYQSTTYPFFYAGVTTSNDFFSTAVWFGFIVLIILIDYMDYKKQITDFGYIYLISGGHSSLYNICFKRNVKNTFLFLVSYNLIPIIINIKTIDWLLALKINIILFSMLMVYKTIVLMLNYLYNSFISLVGVSLIILIVPLVCQNKPYLYIVFPINYVMQFRVTIFDNITAIPLSAVIVSIVYLGLCYLITREIICRAKERL